MEPILEDAENLFLLLLLCVCARGNFNFIFIFYFYFYCVWGVCEVCVRCVCEVYVARVEDWGGAERFMEIVECSGDCNGIF